MYNEKTTFKCPYCGSTKFYFKGTFTTKAEYDEDLNEFVFTKLCPEDLIGMYCSYCEKYIDEMELLDHW